MGTIVRNGVTYSGGNGVKELTLEEYNAIPTKNKDIVYFIKDADEKDLTTKYNKNLADFYLMNKDYIIGDYCIFNNQLYEFIEDKPAGDWDESKVRPITIKEKITKINSDLNDVVNKVDEGISIRFNEEAEVVQIYNNGIWQDWLTINHDGIIVVSSATFILDSSDASIGDDVSGGWTPDETFYVTTSGSGDTRTNSVESTTNNSISMNNIKHIDFTCKFTNSSGDTSDTSSNAYIEVFLIDEEGNKVNTTKVTNATKKFSTFTITLNTSDLIGMYKIGYKLAAYYKKSYHSASDGHGGTSNWTSTCKVDTGMKKIGLYTI